MVADTARPQRVEARAKQQHSSSPRADLLAFGLLWSCFACILISAPSLDCAERRHNPIVESSAWWTAARRAYDRHHCLTRPTASLCSAARPEVVSVIEVEPSALSNDTFFAKAALEDGGSGSDSAPFGGDGCGGAFICSCGREFAGERALQKHRLRTRCPLRTEPCDAPDEPVATDVSADLCQEVMEREVDDIAEEFLDECTELRYEQYISPANVQRVKDLVTRVTAQQTAAIKRAVAPHLQPNANLDDLIDPIMQATDRYRTEWREQSGRVQRQSYRVQPVRRSLGTHPVEHDLGGGRMETRQEELFVYDIPIEQSLQRELLYNPEFGEHMCDWAERPPNEDGSYTSTQDGTVARTHPVLGNSTYEGPSRLAFAHYYDDVEGAHADLCVLSRCVLSRPMTVP